MIRPSFFSFDRRYTVYKNAAVSISRYSKYTDKKEIQIYLIYKEIQSGAVASSYMGKYLRISSYMKKPLLIYDFATAPLWISLYMRKILFYFLSV